MKKVGPRGGERPKFYYVDPPLVTIYIKVNIINNVSIASIMIVWITPNLTNSTRKIHDLQSVIYFN